MRLPNGVYRYCGNCRYFVEHRQLIDDGCTHPLVPDWYNIGMNVDACPLHKFIIDDETEEEA